MMAKFLLAAAVAALVRVADGLGATDTITWGGDNSRAGYQTNHNMDPAIVGSDDFAQIFKTALPGTYNGAAEQVFSQPLVYTPSGGTAQYVYFATTQNNVYKLDAKTGVILAARNLAIPFLTADLDGCVDINPTIGITSTGVIDPATDTLYLTVKTYANQAGGTAAQGKPNGRYFVHALDANDLSERANFPVGLEGISARNNPQRIFNGGIHHQRPALLHAGQYIYAGFASHCVQYNFTGWLMGFDKTTGAVVERFATEGDGVPYTTPGGGIWMSGGGLASDDKGSLFFGTGNGYASQLSTVPYEGRSPPTSLEEAAVHMTLNADGSVTLVDFFMPQEKQALDGADKDLGTSPLEILPAQFACGSVSRIGVITGKSGKTYFLNLDDLGGYRTGADYGDNVLQVYQNENSVYAGAGVYPLEGGYIYINVIQYPTHVFKFSCNNGVPTFTKVADSPESNSYILGVSHGTVTSLNGQEGTGLLWTTDVQGKNLRIYNAVPDNGLLTEIKSFSVPGTTKFTRAVFGDGRLYMGTTLGYVYGFGAPVTPALNCTTPVDFGRVDLAAAAATATVTCTALTATTVKALNLTDADFHVAGAPTLPLALAAGAQFSFSASFAPTAVGLLTGTVSIATTNGAAGFASTTSVLLEGTGESADALLTLSPTTLVFTNVVIGATPGGSKDPVTLTNEGGATLDITQIRYSDTSAAGPWLAATAAGNATQVGAFTLTGLPATLAAGSGRTVEVAFDPTAGGNYTLFVVISSTGGDRTLEITANAGPAPTCLVEFQTPDGLGWVTYAKGSNFTFGNVTENTSRTLKMRVTNQGSADTVPLSITVSKPPFGVAGIIGAANQVDLAEGTVLAAGESATASLYCAVPKEQWNSDPYYGAAVWTMNTNDPNWDKQYMAFSCVAVAEQAPPLDAAGQGVYRYTGCFKENNPGRQLSSQLYGSANNTAAMCIAACAAGKYTYCGTQYNTECWGGNTIPVQSVADGNCNYPCAGDINQYCGGNGLDGEGAYISLFAVSGADTNSSTADPTGPVVNPGAYGYASIGCYHEPATGRALANQLSVASQTIDSCLAAAAVLGYAYAGVEYGGECWAGSSLDAGAANASLASCSMTCNGNGSEYCGAALLLNVYHLNGTATLPPTSSGTGGTTTPTTPAGPVTNPGVGGYVFYGCYHEPATGRAFANQLSVTNQTVGSCIAAAAAQGYTYAAIEYGGECWAGSSINAGAAATSTGSCSMTCNNNATEYCGGSLVLDVYRLNGTATLPPTSSGTGGTTAPTTPAGPVTNPGVNGYTFYGCYHEPATGRAFTNQLSVTNQTVGSCIAAAAAQGYTYAAIEYGGECWAGNSVAAGATAVATSSCSMTCNGNATEYCGGSLLLDVYRLNGTAVVPTTASTAATTAPTTATTTPAGGPFTNPGVNGYKFYGCYHEPATGRAFTNQLSVTSQTVANCVAAALAQGYSYAAVEYGGECWAGNSVAAGATAVATSSCSMTCNGNATEYCGGSLLLDVYRLNGTAATTVATTVATTAGTTVATTTPTTTAVTGGPYTNPGVNGYKFYGCYHEPATGRAFTDQLSVTGQTVANCVAAAAAKGYTFAAVEYGGECWAGNSVAAGATAVATSSCSMTCNGNATEYCGGSLLLDVYRLNGTVATTVATTAGTTAGTTVATTTTPTTAVTGGPYTNPGTSGYAFLGCWHEPTAARALPNQLSVTNQTVANCLAAAALGHYTYAGLEYGGECWVGNTLNTAAAQAALSSCSMTCNGNKTEYCGAGNLLDLYQLSSTAAAAAKTATTATTATATVAPAAFRLTLQPAGTTSANTSTGAVTTSTSTTSTTSSTSTSTTSTSTSTSTTSSSSLKTTSTSSSRTSTSTASPTTSTTSSSTSSSTTSSTKTSTSSSTSSFTSSTSSSTTSSTKTLSTTSTSTTSSTSSTSSTKTSSTASPTTSTKTSSTASPSTTSSTSSTSSTKTSTTSSTTSATPSTVSSSSAAPSASPSAPVFAQGNVNFTILSCVQEPSPGQLLAKFVARNTTSMTVASCLSKCWSYTYAGLENGDACWCGDALRLSSNSTTGTPGQAVEKAQCDTPCTGNETEYCGSLHKLLVYNLTRVHDV